MSSTAPADVCYGVSAVMKNIKPNTKYYITFKEKRRLYRGHDPAHGLYLKPDTASTVSDVTDAAQVTHAALTRNNGDVECIRRHAPTRTGRNVL